MILLLGALVAPTPASAHCGEHADSCGVAEWREVAGGGCVNAVDPYEYGTWMQPYEVWATWCFVPVRCVQATCTQNVDCGANRSCVNGLCSCPPGKLAPCAMCGDACLQSEQEVPFADDARCWPWGIEANVPCAGPAVGGTWRNHGQYVSAVARLLNAALHDGLITEAQHDALMEAAGESSCGAV